MKRKNNSIGVKAQFKSIEATLKNLRDGASIEEILTAAPLKIELRTLQRRLAKLKEMGIVTTSGDTRSTRYHIIAPEVVMGLVAEDEEESGKVYGIPLAAAGRQLLSIISLPERQRKPVGYQRKFLDNYRPNADYYLTPGDLRQLAKIGKTQGGKQPAGTYAREMLNRLLIDLSWNSSRLEGNTYSLLDTERLISMGEVADNKTMMEAEMILNHKDAIEFIVEQAGEIRFNRYTILNLHAMLSNNLLPDPAASGRLRRISVGIHQSVYTPPGIPQQIEEYFDRVLEKANMIENPFEQAFFIMVQLPYLQPFDDVNKRVSRLAANIPLVRHNLAPLSFIDVPNDLYVRGMLAVYELNRVELLKDVFLWAYERSSLRYAAIRQSVGDPDPFRLKYRSNIRALVSAIVSNKYTSKEASAKIFAEASLLPSPDQAKFTETVETELMSLHEGNFARYGLRPAEFEAWKQVWKT